MKKVNMNISDELVKWFEEKASEIGISRTALMCIAMNEYRENRENMKALNNVQVLINEMNAIEQRRTENEE